MCISLHGYDQMNWNWLACPNDITRCQLCWNVMRICTEVIAFMCMFVKSVISLRVWVLCRSETMIVQRGNFNVSLGSLHFMCFIYMYLWCRTYLLIYDEFTICKCNAVLNTLKKFFLLWSAPYSPLRHSNLEAFFSHIESKWLSGSVKVPPPPKKKIMHY